MRRIITITFLSIYASFLFSMDVSVDHAVFKTTEGTYLETYLRVLQNSITFSKVDQNKKQASVEFLVTISQKNKIVAFEKYILNSPHLQNPKDMLDVKRFAIPSGSYVLKIEGKDLNDDKNTVTLEKRVDVYDLSDGTTLSDVQLLGKVEKMEGENPMIKNGIYMEPLSYSQVPEDINSLNVYAEFYQSTSSQHFYILEVFEGFDGVGGNSIMKKVNKIPEQSIVPLLVQLPFDKVPSGNYHLKFKVIDKQKNVISERIVDFTRANQKYDQEYWANFNKEVESSFVSDMNEEELVYILRACAPIIYEPKRSILNYMIKEAPVQAKRKFVLDFWVDKSPENTYFNMQKYLEFAKAIDLEYNSNVGYGFETDRGYTFLRYGKPNNVLDIDQEVDAFPYEIWYYDFIPETNQSNVRFLFYNKSLVHNDYSLLHSTCRGERQNPNWEIELYRKGLEVPQDATIDATNIQDNWNRHARKYFNEF